MNYKLLAYEYIKDNFGDDDYLYPLAASAASELNKKHGKSWEFIYRSFRKKPVEDWRKYRFGLMFKPRFHACIERDIEISKQQENFDVEQWEKDMQSEDTDHKKTVRNLSPTHSKDFVF